MIAASVSETGIGEVICASTALRNAPTVIRQFAAKLCDTEKAICTAAETTDTEKNGSMTRRIRLFFTLQNSGLDYFFGFCRDALGRCSELAAKVCDIIRKRGKYAHTLAALGMRKNRH